MYTYDALKEKVLFPTISSVPAATERDGIFQSWITVYDSLTTRCNDAGVLVRDPFAGN